VQASREEVEGELFRIKENTVTIGWGDDIESLNGRYGSLTIDYFNYLVGGDFVVGYEGLSC
jgi:hypothetical protein